VKRLIAVSLFTPCHPKNMMQQQQISKETPNKRQLQPSFKIKNRTRATSKNLQSSRKAPAAWGCQQMRGQPLASGMSNASEVLHIRICQKSERLRTLSIHYQVTMGDAILRYTVSSFKFQGPEKNSAPSTLRKDILDRSSLADAMEFRYKSLKKMVFAKS
jgi:uncharacterized protein VirK/YbjX